MKLHLKEDYDDSLFKINGDTLVGVYKDQLPDDGYLVVPEGIRVLGRDCLAGLGLNTVILPDTLKIIEREALSNNQLTELIIPKGVEKLEKYFIEGNNITELTVPNTVKNCSFDSFRGVDNLNVEISLDLLSELIDHAKEYKALTSLDSYFTAYKVMFNGKPLRYWNNWFRKQLGPSVNMSPEQLKNLETYIVQNTDVTKSNIKISRIPKGCKLTFYAPNNTFVVQEPDTQKYLNKFSTPIPKYIEIIDEFCKNNNLEIVSRQPSYQGKGAEGSSFWIRMKPGAILTIKMIDEDSIQPNGPALESYNNDDTDADYEVVTKGYGEPDDDPEYLFYNLADNTITNIKQKLKQAGWISGGSIYIPKGTQFVLGPDKWVGGYLYESIKIVGGSLDGLLVPFLEDDDELCRDTFIREHCKRI